MAVNHICPVCGEKMFHDKSNHITFCACGHVGWPHDAPAVPVQKEAAEEEGDKPVEDAATEKK